jgi:hypothetical protein
LHEQQIKAEDSSGKTVKLVTIFEGVEKAEGDAERASMLSNK